MSLGRDSTHHVGVGTWTSLGCDSTHHVGVGCGRLWEVLPRTLGGQEHCTDTDTCVLPLELSSSAEDPWQGTGAGGA